MSRFICSSNFTQKHSLNTRLNERRCKSPLAIDLIKLKEYLFE